MQHIAWMFTLVLTCMITRAASRRLVLAESHMTGLMDRLKMQLPAAGLDAWLPSWPLWLGGVTVSLSQAIAIPSRGGSGTRGLAVDSEGGGRERISAVA